MNLQKNYSLKSLNTFGIDAKAKYFVEIQSEEELQEFYRTGILRVNNFFVLGGGSNILFTKDYDGVVVKYLPNKIKIMYENSETVLIESDGGVGWDDLVRYTVANLFYGIENLALIPGTVGAAPIQNIGAYGTELKDVFHSLEYFDITTGLTKKLFKGECCFQYRNSIFKNKLKNKTIITKVVLELTKKKKLNLSYKALKDELSQINEEQLSIQLIYDTVKKIRESKIPDPKIHGNAGSFFKNPEIDSTQLKTLKENFPDIVSFKQSEKSFKVSAGWLIEKCGYKGKRIGNVGSFEKQALVIINYGNATGQEIFNYADQIRIDVQKLFSINLEYEVNII